MAPVHSLGTLMLSSCISQSPLHVGEHGRDTYNYSLPIFFSSHSNHPFAATFTKITFVKIPSELCDLRWAQSASYSTLLSACDESCAPHSHVTYLQRHTSTQRHTSSSLHWPFSASYESSFSASWPLRYKNALLQCSALFSPNSLHHTNPWL